MGAGGASFEGGTHIFLDIWGEDPKGGKKEESRGLDRSCFQRQSPPTVEQVGYGLRLKAVYAPITGHPLVTRHTKAYS